MVMILFIFSSLLVIAEAEYEVCSQTNCSNESRNNCLNDSDKKWLKSQYSSSKCMCCPEVQSGFLYTFMEDTNSDHLNYGQNPIDMLYRAGKVGTFVDPLAKKVCGPSKSCKNAAKKCPNGCRCERYCQVYCKNSKTSTCHVEAW